MRQKTTAPLDFISVSHDEANLMTTIIVDTLSSEVPIDWYRLRLESFAMNEPNRVIENRLLLYVEVIDVTRSEAIPEIIEIKKSEGTYTFSVKKSLLGGYFSFI